MNCSQEPTSTVFFGVNSQNELIYKAVFKIFSGIVSHRKVHSRAGPYGLNYCKYIIVNTEMTQLTNICKIRHKLNCC